MGSFSTLEIGGYPTFSYKNGYDSAIVTALFRPEDFLIEQRPKSLRSKLTWGEVYEDDMDDFTFYGFRQTVDVCKKRLEIFGTSLRSVRNNFKDAVNIAGGNDWYGPDYDFKIQAVSYPKYISALRKIIQNKIVRYDNERDTLENALITDGLMIHGQSYPDALYAMLSCVDDTSFVEYDLTDVIEGGWVEKSIAEKVPVEKIIIITEGKTDADFISKSLNLLYPYLTPYYHFMDFEGFRVEANASALVKTLKSFAAAGVKHPIIAIFDNDTAGIAEMNKVPKNLLSNIQVIKLPDIQLAKKYPTIGPSGQKKMNVNGWACGIEMYLGKDLLHSKDGFAKIRWTNFDPNTKQYQGSLENKVEIQELFLSKVKSGDTWDMEEMHLLLNRIFTAFKD